MKYSIIIPTAFDSEQRIRECVESVRKYTDDTNVEVIIVANGCTWDVTVDHAHVLSFPNAIGYPAAINLGASQAQGQFIIPLNDDTILLEQPSNQWIEMLSDPFVNENVAITGAWKNWCPYAERDFLIFFCVMIRKSVFDQLGGLDESFGAGYGEDCDFCCKCEDAGYQVLQVPYGDKLAYDGFIATGGLPIYHAGNKTFSNWPGGEELLRKNREILKERYSCNIGKALECDGFMSPEELRWLAKESRKASTVIELGSWHGRSTRAIADNLRPGGKLYAIDTWQGSETEKETNHKSAQLLDGDHAFDEFTRNLFDLIQAGRVVPLRIHGRNAANLLKDKGIKADLVFVDAGHTYSEVEEDIRNFLPLVKPGGLICGHDYMQGLAPEVTHALLDIFGQNIGHAPNTTIWYTDAKPKLTVYDCVTFFDELDLLEQRFRELDRAVDRFVVCEAAFTHQGKPKPLYFNENLSRFDKWIHKVSHIIAEFHDLPIGDEVWGRERQQRDAISQALPKSGDGIVVISDCDEIPNPEAIRQFSGGIQAFEMDLFYYDFNTKSKHTWQESRITTLEMVRRLSPCGVRYARPDKIIYNGGKHCSYFGGVEQVKRKLESFAHAEYNKPEFTNEDHIRNCIENGLDIFDRPEEQFVK